MTTLKKDPNESATYNLILNATRRELEQSREDLTRMLREIANDARWSVDRLERGDKPEELVTFLTSSNVREALVLRERIRQLELSLGRIQESFSSFVIVRDDDERQRITNALGDDCCYSIRHGFHSANCRNPKGFKPTISRLPKNQAQ